MRALILSAAGSLLHLAFAVLAVLIAHRLRGDGGTRAVAWRLTAWVFALYALDDVSQLAFATVAYVLGPESPIFTAYLWWAPIANHSRTFVVWSLYLGLAGLALSRPSARPHLVRGFPIVVLAMLVGGGMIGWSEGSFDAARHLSATAVLDTVGFVGLSGVLFLTMIRGTIDRALWFALVAYGSASVISSLFLAAMAWAGVAGAWTPPVYAMELVRLTFGSAMVALASWRLRLAWQGLPLAGLLGEEPRRPVLT